MGCNEKQLTGQIICRGQLLVDAVYDVLNTSAHRFLLGVQVTALAVRHFTAIVAGKINYKLKITHVIGSEAVQGRIRMNEALGVAVDDRNEIGTAPCLCHHLKAQMLGQLLLPLSRLRYAGTHNQRLLACVLCYHIRSYYIP